MCDTHYTRQRKGKPIDVPIQRWTRTASVAARIAEETALATRTADGCLLAVGARSRKGYVQVKIGGVVKNIHRWVLELKLGRSLRADEHARHLCHVPHCINPDHLAPGSCADNRRDSQYVNRLPSKLTPDTVREARTRYAAGGVTYRQLADEYGVGIVTVYSAIQRRTWKHVD